MRHSALLFSLLLCISASAQLPQYTELSDTKPHSSDAEWAGVKALSATWGSIDVRYAKRSIPSEGLSKKWTARAWRGEKVSGQAVVFTPGDAQVSISSTPLRGKGGVIPGSAVSVAFVRYVMGDQVNRDGKGACRDNNVKAEWDSTLCADALDATPSMKVEARTARPIWVSVSVPQTAAPGTYSASLVVEGADRKISLPYSIQVVKRVLPTPDKWTFHLDLWQNPYAVARYYGVPLWSKQHFDLMRPLMKMYAAAGGKVITAAIINRPWAGQTEDAFGSMVVKTKKIDGSWAYDYTVFDRWVEFMMECGVTEQIDCYTVVPWALTFDYIDQATGAQASVKAEPGSAAYRNYWLPFLKDFAAHLESKGWLGKTAIAMDERPRESMKAAEEIIFGASKKFKIAGAIHYYPDVEPNIYDLCLSYGETVPDSVLRARQAAGKKTTIYTCCAEAYPNTFTFSRPAEATWLPLHAAAIGVDGYLRWAYNSWTTDPLADSRFRSWASGDCYLVYPGGSSIRMERLVEGIQDYEKIMILRKELAKSPAKLKKLNAAVARFIPQNLHGANATEMVNAFKRVISEY